MEEPAKQSYSPVSLPEVEYKASTKVSPEIKNEGGSEGKIVDVVPLAVSPSAPESHTPIRVGEEEDAKGEGEISEKDFKEAYETMRATPVAITSIKNFQYHQQGVKNSLPLIFEEAGVTARVRIHIEGAEKHSEEKVKELIKTITSRWETVFKSRGALGKAMIYFLKYRRLETRDRKALERMKDFARKGNTCFIFADTSFEHIPKVMRKLQEIDLLPQGCVFFPWEPTITEDQKKAIMGLVLSSKFEDQTQSRRTVTRVLIPSSRKV